MPGIPSYSEDWIIKEDKIEKNKLPFWETLFTIGNGYIGIRGVLEEGFYGCYPGTYIAGIYDKNTSVSYELVNAPNPICMEICIDDEVMNIDTMGVLEHNRILDMSNATLSRRTIFVDAQGNRYEYASRRYFSLVNIHLGVLEVQFRSLDRDCNVKLRKYIDGGTENKIQPSGEPVRHYTIEKRYAKGNFAHIEVKTIDLGLRIGIGTGIAYKEKIKFKGIVKKDKTINEGSFFARKGKRYSFVFYISVYASKDLDKGIKDMCLNSVKMAMDSWERLLSSHKRAWQKRWKICDIEVDNKEIMRALRFNMYHLLIAAPPDDMDVSIGARTLSGEWYKGHVFWDTEIYIIPFFIHTQPRVARNLLMYRYRRINHARGKASHYGYRGAFWPWESALSGDDVTPEKWIDMKGTIIPVYNAEREIHICGDIIYAIWNYHTATGDLDFMLDAGYEMLFETARFWPSRVDKNDDGKHEIKRIIGPNEFQECVNNNSYTNFLAKFTLDYGYNSYMELRSEHPRLLEKISQKINLYKEEVDEWPEIAENIFFLMNDGGMIEEFENYFELRDIQIKEWDDNRKPLWPEDLKFQEIKYTQLVKQADVVMLFHLFPNRFSPKVQRINIDYYDKRTMHKSSLSPPCYALAYLNLGMIEEAWKYFLMTLCIDLKDIYANTFQGLHAATLGGSWQIMVYGFAGIRAKTDGLSINPQLPDEINYIRFRYWYRKTLIEFEIKREVIEASVIEGKGNITIEHNGNKHTLTKDRVLKLR